MRQQFVISLLIANVLMGCAIEADDAEKEFAQSTESAIATDASIYVDGSLVAPWRNWGWSTTVALANADAPLATSSKSQMKVTSTGAWGALALAHSTADMLVADFDAISFDVRASSAMSLQIAIEPLAGANIVSRADIAVTTTWTRQTVKLSALAGSLTKFGKVDWIVPVSGKTFYLDNVRLVPKSSTTTPVVSPTPSAPAPTVPPPSTTPPSGAVPTSPLAVKKGDVVTLTYAGGSYSLFVPSTYDATHATPAPLLLWMHGCGGNAYGDAWVVSPGGTQRWISVSVGGRDGKCWNTSTDAALALGALDDVSKKLNVDRRRIVIGGYSSGGDMAYRTAFMNAKRFAGVVAENTSPFRDTGWTQTVAIAAAAWKLNVAHLAHVGDTTYPIAKVRTETDALKAAGFPMTRIEKEGSHYDQDTANTGTTYDLRKFLLPYVDSGWVSPL